MPQSILDIVIRTMKQGGADKETIKGLVGMKDAVGKAMTAFGALAAATVVLDQGFKATVGTMVAYADQVRSVQEATGVSAEEASRLIQVTDDAKVSYEALTKSMVAMTKNGVTPSIETMAALSDEYLKLQPGAERGKFLLDQFGKSGLEMAEFMGKGGDAIRQMSNEISGSLVLTQQAVDSAREYEMQMDELNDQWEALKVGVGTKAVPALNDFLWGLNNNAAIIEERNRLIEEGITTDFLMANQMAMTNLKLQEQTGGLDSAGMSYRAYAESMGTAQSAMEDMGPSIEEMTAANQGMLSLIMQLQGQTDSFNQRNGELQAKYDELTASQAAFTAGSAEYQDIQAEMDATKTKMSELATQYEADTARIAFSLLQQKVAADGISDVEFDNLLKIGQDMGVIDAATVEAATSMNKQMDSLASGIQTPLDTTKELKTTLEQLISLNGSEINILLNYTTTGTPPDPGTVPGYAVGGSFDAGKPMRVHQDEILVPGYDGVVLTRTDAMRLMSGQAGGGGRSITINGGMKVYVTHGSVPDALEGMMS